MDSLEDLGACWQASITVSIIFDHSGSRSKSLNVLFHKYLDAFAWHMRIWSSRHQNRGLLAHPEVFFKLDTGWLVAKILSEGPRNPVRQESVSDMTKQACKCHSCSSRQFRDTIRYCGTAGKPGGQPRKQTSS
jgi:hypothetical protein